MATIVAVGAVSMLLIAIFVFRRRLPTVPVKSARGYFLLMSLLAAIAGLTTTLSFFFEGSVVHLPFAGLAWILMVWLWWMAMRGT